MALSFFHASEYVATATYNPGTLSLNSFLVNHSREYTIAAIVSWIEYAIEYTFFPSIKSFSWLCWIGLVVVIVGEATRKLAMLTAMSKFHTHGRFPKPRQPHFSQAWHLLLLQIHRTLAGSTGPLAVRYCSATWKHLALGYTAASWVFFKDRIEDEEEMLLLFFGREYVDYSRRVPTGLPFIKGYSGDVEELLSQPVPVANVATSYQWNFIVYYF